MSWPAGPPGCWSPSTTLTRGAGDLPALRAAYESLHAQFEPLPEVEVRPVNTGGVASLLLMPPPQRPATLLYLHGGGFVLGSAFGYRALAGSLAADLTGLPPLLVQAATRDTVLPEARQLTDRARDHGVEARLKLYPVATHVFHTFWSFLPEAADALEQAGAFVRELQQPAEVGLKPS